jgi:predicted metal-binding membrane protein
VTVRTTTAAALLTAASLAWVGVIALSRGMGAMSGTMGLGLLTFLAVWALMMAAMMLPGVVPFASFYAGATATTRAEGRWSGLAAGYLVVWALAGLPVFVLAAVVDALVDDHRTAATALAATLLVVAGVYQLTPLKDRCLAHCRSPLGFVLRHGGIGRGRDAARDVRMGVLHGAYCVGCCWALMLLLVAFGLMNVPVMLALAALVIAEKLHPAGVGVARIAGVLSIALAILVVVRPSLAPGLYHSPTMRGSM